MRPRSIALGIGTTAACLGLIWWAGGVDVLAKASGLVRGEPGSLRLTAESVARSNASAMLAVSPTFDDPPPAPGSDAAAAVMATLAGVEERTRSTRYQHRTQVSDHRGEYFWDCSGMTGWILEHAAPRARRGVPGARPVARWFYAAIRDASTDRARRGWQRIDHIRDVLPGDVFAWRTPAELRSNNTGHVGFVVNRPIRLDETTWAVRILDSTSIAHQDDARVDHAEGGTGRGTMTFETDGEGHVTGYGWFGTRLPLYLDTPVLFGRVH